MSAGLQLLDRNEGDQLPGQVSWSTVGDEHVFLYHDADQGAVEIGRLFVAAVDHETAWLVALVIQCVICVFDALLIGFVASTVGGAIVRAFRVTPGVIDSIKAVIAVPLTGMTFINVVKALYQAGIMGQVLASSLAGVSFWSWAFTLAAALFSIASLFLTGGTYLAVVVALLAFDLCKLVNIIANKDKTASIAAPSGAST